MRYTLVALWCLTWLGAMAQTEKIKSGIIKYKITYTHTSAAAVDVSQLPVKCELIFNEKEYRTIMKNERDSIVLETVTNEAVRVSYQLVNFYGKKYAIKNKLKKSDKENIKMVRVHHQLTNIFLSHECNKVEITFNNGITTTGWYSKDIIKTGRAGKDYKIIDGALLEYAYPLDNNGTLMTLLATEIVTANAESIMPADYKICSQKYFDKLTGARY